MLVLTIGMQACRQVTAINTPSNNQVSVRHCEKSVSLKDK